MEYLVSLDLFNKGTQTYEPTPVRLRVDETAGETLLTRTKAAVASVPAMKAHYAATFGSEGKSQDEYAKYIADMLETQHHPQGDHLDVR